MMEREVTDSEGVFSRRLHSNWAELPQTLRKKPQRHRPEILSQFTDMSESECEYRSLSGSHYQSNNNNNHLVNKRVVRRSEFLRRLENKNLLHLQHPPPPHYGPSVQPQQQQQQQPYQEQQNLFRRSLPDYRLQYEAKDIRRRSLVNLENGNGNSHFHEKYSAKMHFSDDERKTNSPDSLLVRSSESESSISDEYGHTDDSGAFLEKASSVDKKKQSPSEKRIESEQQPHSITFRHRFAKFFNKQSADTNGKSPEPSSKVDVNKNNVQPKKEKFEYENIPRIDLAKLEQRKQPSIEQLRMEEGCQLRNRRNSNVEQLKSMEELQLIKDYYVDDPHSMKGTINDADESSKLSVREILKRFEELRSQPNDGGDRTLNTIQETLQKLDEKVKSYQVLMYIFFSSAFVFQWEKVVLISSRELGSR